MNDLQIFKNAEFGEIRTVIIENEPWFVGKDVAVILGYADPNKAIAMHVDEDDKLNDKSASSLGQRGGWLIKESGLYSLSKTRIHAKGHLPRCLLLWIFIRKGGKTR